MTHAALARRQDEWDRTAFLASWIECKISGKWIDPDRLNPYRKAVARVRRPASETENKVAWAVLGNYLRGR